MGIIDPETVRRILDTANIVEVVSDFVSLKRRGANYIGLCPFHNERTPSFSVSPARGICKCFSCGKGGSPVGFIMEHEQMSYGEALRYLARKYNIEIREREQTDEERALQSERESMFAANDFALRHFEHNLTEDPDGRAVGLAYFRERGINDEMIARFHLGYALERNALYAAAHAQGFDDKVLADTGLCIRRDDGTLYDRFRGRVMYPVHSISGKVVAFGGRTLRSDKQMAKYVNSPESAIYHKSDQLYGLYQAKRAIVERGKCILVEGYMDVISMHQSGVQNVVASSGTSLTDGQIRLIHRFTENVTVIYDSDAAGIKASLRGIDMLLAEGLNIKVLLLPDGDDPDSFAQHHSSEEVETYIKDNETDFIRFKTRILLKDAANDPIQRAQVINDILRSVAVIPDVVKRQVYLAECSRSLGISEEALSLQLSKISAQRAEVQEKEEQRRQARDSIGDLQDAPPQVSAQDDTDASMQRERAFRYPYERELARLIAKYALCYICDMADEHGATTPMNVLQYVDAEMQKESMVFSDPTLAKIVDCVRETAELWPEMLPGIRARLQQEKKRYIDNAINELRGRDLSVAAINAGEATAKADAEAKYAEAMDLAALDFIGRTLCSSPDDDIRRVSTELIIEPYRLSKVHTKHTRIETERESLARIVPRAIYELEGAILELLIRKTQKQLGGPDADEKLVEYMRLTELRRNFAQELGERTITPRKF